MSKLSSHDLSLIRLPVLSGILPIHCGRRTDLLMACQAWLDQKGNGAKRAAGDDASKLTVFLLLIESPKTLLIQLSLQENKIHWNIVTVLAQCRPYRCLSWLAIMVS